MNDLQEILEQIALTENEYDLIVQKIERTPNLLELGLFGALWSEHCGYKHSKSLLKTFPNDSDAVRIKAGEENAGVVDIGDGLGLVFKIESHNHPSAVEPYQGAATGIGGIVRDILAMGARPIALLNSLRFGELDNPHNQHLFNGVVAGISGYGNCIGVPNVGGEVVFSSSYDGNPLVNAMCMGLLSMDQLMRSAATNPGSLLMIVGSATGRDGIHGASGLASRSFDDKREMRPTVQVGDPFLEKVLIEACLEAAKSGFVEAMQDMGAAGLTSSVMECIAKGNLGVDLNVDLIPRREPDMSAYEVMLSESQERMLLIVAPENEEEIKMIFSKWDLDAITIGNVTEGNRARIFEKGIIVADLDVQVLVAAPIYHPVSIRPEYLNRLHELPMPDQPPHEQCESILKTLLSSPNICGKQSVFRRYDHEVQTRTVVKPGDGDSAILRLKESSKGLAVSVDGNARFTYLNPYVGGAMAVAEACRNVAVTGAKPLAITDCLNFGNPEKPEVYYQLEECIRGMADACRALGIPVISGNVSLYNETAGKSIHPTAIVGAVGVLSDCKNLVNMGFQNVGDSVFLIGEELQIDESSLAGSEYLSKIHGQESGNPSFNLNKESSLHKFLSEVGPLGLLNSAHDCSDGGIAVALSECCIMGALGFKNEGDWFSDRWDTVLYGELSSRIIVSCDSADELQMKNIALQNGLPVIKLGKTTDSQFMIEDLIDCSVDELQEAYCSGLVN
ncbi:MAG: phosphoribosylformylglycinamidine synthase II [Chloroflexi bacterium]|nr:phosphoribosylformylglycinamidine synthase II [Chloroflexota bacterium]|tara:strand:- start:8754 stop:10952 length:2199 start_codon:yes stop_codon:yes gene_type:complete